MNILGPEPIDFRNAREISSTWKRFLSQWRNYEIATGLKKKSEEVRLATFLCVIGSQGQEEYDNFKFETDADKKDIEKVIEKFNISNQNRTSIIVKRNRFLRCK